MYVYIKSEKSCKDNDFHDLFTVGFYRPDGVWEPESDHATKEAAAERVAWLNGAGAAKEAVHGLLDEALNSGDGVYRP